jgi:hypothetical protein
VLVVVLVDLVGLDQLRVDELRIDQVIPFRLVLAGAFGLVARSVTHRRRSSRRARPGA